MNKSILFLLIALSLGYFTLAQAGEQVLPEHLARIESLQRRADNMAFGELKGADGYHLAKARAWLDLATSEYYEKDTSGTLIAAIVQAEALLDALENNQADISMETPAQIQGSESLRTDLLEQVAVLKKHEKFACGQQPLATAEVYLVWAGHEYGESGMSHAESYVRTVENLVYDGKVAIDNCVNVPDQPPPLETITLSGDALFAFNKATLNDSALWRLNELADKIKTVARLEEVILVGHTDHLRSDGHPERNQLLSEQRAESIKQYLAGKGIPEEKIHANGVGSDQPLVECPSKQSKEKQIACLQPNRRVEITLRGSMDVPPETDKQSGAVSTGNKEVPAKNTGSLPE